MDIVRLRLASRSALQLKSIKNSRPRAYVMSAPGLWGSPREFSPSDVVENRCPQHRILLEQRLRAACRVSRITIAALLTLLVGHSTDTLPWRTIRQRDSRRIYYRPEPDASLK